MDDLSHKQLANHWLVVAKTNLDTAAWVKNTGDFRSAASRAYYSAFSATHAVVYALGSHPVLRDRVSLPHGKIPGELRWTLRHHLPHTNGAHRNSDLYKDQIEDAYSTRILADYHPQANIREEQVDDSLDAARSIIRLAERIAG
ncbi:MAG TPA: HEPN domain-containing protein [Phycisphaerales bacterium]|nr:HEPN domain-containing protein [Phycisphaerales bacterium]